MVTGSVLSQGRSAGSIQLGVGSGTDLLTADGSSASVNGRLKLGRHFDLGLGGIYGPVGIQRSWAARLSPRFYFEPSNKAPVVTALELGFSGGRYMAGDYDAVDTQQPIHLYPAPFGSVDISDW